MPECQLLSTLLFSVYLWKVYCTELIAVVALLAGKDFSQLSLRTNPHWMDGLFSSEHLYLAVSSPAVALAIVSTRRRRAFIIYTAVRADYVTKMWCSLPTCYEKRHHLRLLRLHCFVFVLVTNCGHRQRCSIDDLSLILATYYAVNQTSVIYTCSSRCAISVNVIRD